MPSSDQEVAITHVLTLPDEIVDLLTDLPSSAVLSCSGHE